MFLDCSGADMVVYDHSDKNPFMLAVEKGQLKVAKLMIEKVPDLVSLQLGSGVTLIHWALERGLDTFFKVSYTNTVTSLLNSCILEFTLVKYHISVFQTKGQDAAG